MSAERGEDVSASSVPTTAFFDSNCRAIKVLKRGNTCAPLFSERPHVLIGRFR